MADGDDAVAAGMPILAGTADRRNGWNEINKTRDYIAQRTSSVQPVAKGGTGATTPAAARTNLDVPSTTDLAGRVQNTSYPTNAILMRWELSRVVVKIDASDQGQIAYVSDVNGAVGTRVAKSGDSMSGDLFIPGSSAATSGFTVCYVNGDGRISRGSSSRRYKKNISDRDPMDLGDLFSAPWVRYQMKADSSLDNDGHMPADPTWRYGYIAESLIGTDMEGFVVYVDGEVESIDFIGLLLAQASQLDRRAVAAEERADALETRLEALKADQAAMEARMLAALALATAPATPPPADPPTATAPAAADDPEETP